MLAGGGHPWGTCGLSGWSWAGWGLEGAGRKIQEIQRKDKTNPCWLLPDADSRPVLIKTDCDRNPTKVDFCPYDTYHLSWGWFDIIRIIFYRLLSYISSFVESDGVFSSLVERNLSQPISTTKKTQMLEASKHTQHFCDISPLCYSTKLSSSGPQVLSRLLFSSS